MEFRQLEVFVTVAETKSFSKAADYLYLTQSTVSSHIKNLEKEIKKKLFIRSTKSLKLTREGASFLWYARRIIETRDAALENINSSTKHILHLGASTIPSGYLLPKLLAGFRKKYPHICFDIKQSDSTDIQEKIIDGTIELGLVGKKSEAAQCAFIPFCTDELVIAAPANEYYLTMQKKEAPIQQLLNEPIIMREQGSGTQKTIDLFLESIGRQAKNLHVITRTNDLEAIKQMILNNMGIAIVSKYSVENLARDKQIILYPLQTEIKRQFYLTYLKAKNIKPVLQKFIDYTQEIYSL
ncbi:MAG: selenium metabolism-associated LysR family transcriptional regulator [bacterium]